MRPFDLDTAKRGEKVYLRDGTPVRIKGLYGNREGSTFDLMMVNDEK